MDYANFEMKIRNRSCKLSFIETLDNTGSDNTGSKRLDFLGQLKCTKYLLKLKGY